MPFIYLYLCFILTVYVCDVDMYVCHSACMEIWGQVVEGNILLAHGFSNLTATPLPTGTHTDPDLLCFICHLNFTLWSNWMSFSPWALGFWTRRCPCTIFRNCRYSLHFGLSVWKIFYLNLPSILRAWFIILKRYGKTLECHCFCFVIKVYCIVSSCFLDQLSVILYMLMDYCLEVTNFFNMFARLKIEIIFLN